MKVEKKESQPGRATRAPIGVDRAYCIRPTHDNGTVQTSTYYSSTKTTEWIDFSVDSTTRQSIYLL